MTANRILRTIAIEDFLSPRSSLSCTLKMCRCVLEGVSPQTASFGGDVRRRSEGTRVNRLLT